jgi:hypothetical protein
MLYFRRSVVRIGRCTIVDIGKMIDSTDPNMTSKLIVKDERQQNRQQLPHLFPPQLTSEGATVSAIWP